MGIYLLTGEIGVNDKLMTERVEEESDSREKEATVDFTRVLSVFTTPTAPAQVPEDANQAHWK